MNRTPEHYEQHVGKSVRLLVDDCFPQFIGEIGTVVEMYDTDIFSMMGWPSVTIVQVQFGEDAVIACTVGQLQETGESG